MAGGKPLRGARARAQQRDRGRDREQDDAERERQRRDLMAVERREGIEIVGDRTERGTFGSCACPAEPSRGRRRHLNRLSQGCVLPPHRLRIVSGISVPLIPGHGPGMTRRDDIRHVVRESNDFNPKGSRAVRVQTVNGEAAGCGASAKFAIRMSRLCRSTGGALSPLSTA